MAATTATAAMMIAFVAALIPFDVPFGTSPELTTLPGTVAFALAGVTTSVVFVSSTAAVVVASLAAASGEVTAAPQPGQAVESSGICVPHLSQVIIIHPSKQSS